MRTSFVLGPVNDRALQRFTFFCKKTIFDSKSPKATGQDSLLKAASFYLSCPWSARRPVMIEDGVGRLAGALSLTAPVIIECRRPDSSKIPADLVSTRCRCMTATSALAGPRRRPRMNAVPKIHSLQYVMTFMLPIQPDDVARWMSGFKDGLKH